MRNAANRRLRKHNDMTVLLWASELGYTRVVHGVLEAGGDVNALDPSGSSALMLASHQGQNSVVEALIAYNAALDISAQGQTALTHAAQFNHPDILIWLFDCRARFDHRHWWTIFPAAIEGHLDVARVLLEHGVDPNFQLSPSDNSTPMCAHQYRTGQSPLILAVIHQHPDLVELLMKNGANPEAAIRHLVSKESPLCTQDQRCLFELCDRDRRRVRYWNFRCSRAHAIRVALHWIDVIIDFLGPFSVVLVVPAAVVIFTVALVSFGFIAIYGRFCIY
jgi:ankyrin repeat protein